MRHLTDQEVRTFTVELVGVLSDAAVLSIDDAAEQGIEGWRATARISRIPTSTGRPRDRSRGISGRWRWSSDGGPPTGTSPLQP
jgi:hypothetical protein